MAFTMNDAGRKFLAELERPTCSMCSFIDAPCKRPLVGHLCGGVTPALMKSGKTRSLAAAPAWVVFSSWGKPFTPTQQLSIFDGPRIEWDHTGDGLGLPGRVGSRRWYVAVYYCPIGREFAIKTEKALGARSVRIEEVKAIPGLKRKRQVLEYMFCS